MITPCLLLRLLRIHFALWVHPLGHLLGTLGVSLPSCL